MDKLQLQSSQVFRRQAPSTLDGDNGDGSREQSDSSFLALAGQWGQNIGMHGLPNITRSSSKWKKIFWTLLLLAGLTLTVVQIKAIVDKYYSYPISIERGTEIDLPRQFPAVTLCNMSPAKLSSTKAIMSSSASSSSTTSAAYGGATVAPATGAATAATGAATAATGAATAATGAATATTGAATTATTITAAATGAVPAATNDSTQVPTMSTGGPPGRRRKKRDVSKGSTSSSYSGLTSSMYTSTGTRDLNSMGSSKIPDHVGMNYMFLDFYNTLSDSNKAAIGYQLSDMLIECSLGTGYCSEANFTRFLHPMYGNCYTFNAAADNATRVSVKQQGPLFGLSLTLYIDQTEYIGSVAQSAGIVAVVHEPTVQPFPEESGIRVSPGRETYIGLKQTYRKLLPAPYSDECEDEFATANELYNMYNTRTLWSLPNVNYTKMVCLKTCIQTKTESQCNCSSPKLPPSNVTRTPALPVCAYQYNSTSSSVSVSAQCVQNVEETAFAACRSGCKSECNEFRYDAAISMSSWPSNNYEADALLQMSMYSASVRSKMAKETNQPVFVEDNFVKLIVFFDEAEMKTEVSTEGYALTDLLSDMGGQVGLWLGLSVLTLFEILEMMLDFAVLAASKTGRQAITRMPPSQPQQQPLSKAAEAAAVASAAPGRKPAQQPPESMWVDQKLHP